MIRVVASEVREDGRRVRARTHAQFGSLGPEVRIQRRAFRRGTEESPRGESERKSCARCARPQDMFAGRGGSLGESVERELQCPPGVNTNRPSCVHVR